MKGLFKITVFVGIMARATTGAEIGFIEQFALAEDRTKVLQQLIPGTEDHFYFHCLHYQNNEQFDEVDRLLKAWTKQHGYSQRAREIQNRQALLTYPRSPRKSLEHIRQQLNLKFDHQRENLDRPLTLPKSLDQQLISRETLMNRATKRYRNLKGFKDSALFWLAAEPLTAEQRRDLLARLRQPDVPRLAELVVQDLNHKGSRGFGSLAIHRRLVQSQLDDCLTQKVGLRNDPRFVGAYVAKLQPSADADWRNDEQEQLAYLERLAKFVDTLSPAHNSLKAHVLFHRLAFDHSQGVFDKKRFLKYISLPRPVPYIQREFMKLPESVRYACDLRQEFAAITELPRVGNDEPIVRAFLAHFFVTDANFNEYERYIDRDYLKTLFAETKIVEGLGDQQRWYSMLTPEAYEQLKARIDIDFEATNEQVFDVGDPVQLDLRIKNVENLIVKVYEVNASNYYRENGRDVNTDINLDGLVANEETTYKYTDPPLRRVSRHFEFPNLKDPGVYVIDFIGNGRNSRAVVRIGRLRYTVRTTPLGQAFRVYDEKNELLANASIWLAGREYMPTGEGDIVVPFSNRPTRQAIVISHGKRCSLHHFQHESEKYRLDAGIHVDRESLLKHRKAKLIIRPSLLLNGKPITLGRLEDVRLKLTSTNRDAVNATSEVRDFKLYEDRESVHEFQVPARLATIRFDLTARIQVQSQGKPLTLTAQQQFTLNGIDSTETIEQAHLVRGDSGYRIQLTGKTGESKPGRAIAVEFYHRDFSNPVRVNLQTDDEGVVSLGALKEIDKVRAEATGWNSSWTLLRDSRSYQTAMSASVGEPILVPYMDATLRPADVSLLETRGGLFVANRFNAMELKNGFLAIRNLQAGDYVLNLKQSGNRPIQIRVTAGQERDGYVRGTSRQLEIQDKAPLHITSATVEEDHVVLHLANHSEFARVHVFAVRNYPAYSAFDGLSLGQLPSASVMRFPAYRSLYQAGRNIGDEYEYILRRQYAQKFAGNMLARPELLLNPWAVRGTDTAAQDARGGETFEPAADKQSVESKLEENRSKANSPRKGDWSNLDFLGSQSATLTNLTADENGRVTIPRADIGPHQHIIVVAIDPESTVSKSIVLPESAMPTLDLRLANGLDPKQHFTQQKQIKVLRKGDLFELKNQGAAMFEKYDNLASIHRLYSTLSGDASLAEFDFVLRWPEMSEDERQEKYSKHACHELNYFLFKKDRQFFDAVVKPYLSNKRDKTFLDDWLLGNDLESYLDAWKFARLNVVERLLLGQRVQGQRLLVNRHIQDLVELRPVDAARRDHLFDTAVRGSSLVAGKAMPVGGVMFRRQTVADFEGSNDSIPAPQTAAADPTSGAHIASAAPNDTEAEDASESRDSGKKMAGRNSDRGRRYFAEVEEAELAEVRQLYRVLDKTQEWAENNYYKRLITEQNEQLVTASSFWQDYASHDPDESFFSRHWADASHNFTEMMFALSALDLPFESAEHKFEFNDAKMTLTASGPMVAFYQEVRPMNRIAENSRVLVSQNFYRDGDRYRIVDGLTRDKFVTEEFLVHTVYGCQVVVTNPTSEPQKLDVLLEIPVGAIPVRNSYYQRSAHLDLGPYNTKTIEYHFYFPVEGEYAHYPVHVSNENELLAHAQPFRFNVVQKLSQTDKQSWPYVSQFGSNDEVIEFLNARNVQSIDLAKIAFRMADKAFFIRTIETLRQRHAYNHVLWSYSIRHNVVDIAREFLQHADDFVVHCGSFVESKLLSIDPVVRKTYQHLEYKPLVNARTHQLGDQRQILNDRFHSQYLRLMNVLSQRGRLDDHDRMSATYYLLLQDRIGAAMHHFSKVRSNRLQSRIQYDYLRAYLDCFDDDTQLARSVVADYDDYPVDRWWKAFDGVRILIEEVEGRSGQVADADDRDQLQSRLAITEPSFRFDIESKKIRFESQNVESIQINYYLMDIELLFSRNPFVKQVSGRFSHIRPNLTSDIKLENPSGKIQLDLPQQFHNSNVLVEINGHGVRKTQAYYAHSLNVQVIENYGQLRVSESDTARPLSTVYVKVYARFKNGETAFYKDGYTDIRGRFDYASLSTNRLDDVRQFSILVLSESHGAIVTEAQPPKR